ncbi:hypothetical protein DP49_5881 [Burkholderia pseudomallei]|nr:hypothetical protein DP49_5881 [Burkholderia pseudomallei]KGS72896.1 hypothetical protein X942_5962 [Burkholderia pseudomallei MSHR5596]
MARYIQNSGAFHFNHPSSPPIIALCKCGLGFPFFVLIVPPRIIPPGRYIHRSDICNGLAITTDCPRLLV